MEISNDEWDAVEGVDDRGFHESNGTTPIDDIAHLFPSICIDEPTDRADVNDRLDIIELRLSGIEKKLDRLIGILSDRSVDLKDQGSSQLEESDGRHVVSLKN